MSATERHITRDYRNISGKGGRELEFFDHAEDFPGPDDVHDTSEGALWKTPNGWYQRQGEYWAPIYEPHELGAVEALTDALGGNVSCRPSSYGNGCGGAEVDVAEVVNDLCEAGWRLTFNEARP